MKRKLNIILPVITLLSAFTVKTADDIITRLGMQHTEAQKYIFDNLIGDFSNYPNGENGQAYHGVAFKIPAVKFLPEIIKGDKAGAAKELCTYIKKYCNSENFMNDYTRYRNSFKPTREPVRDANVTKANENLVNMYKESITLYEQYLADAKKNNDANSIKLYEKSLADLRKQVATLEDPHPNQTAWEKKYPAKPDGFVKARLEEYLSLVATVDFTAKLIPQKDKMVFANPAYENKSKQWKAIYRAGKEVNTAVTAFVKEWLKGEIISQSKTTMPAESEMNNDKNVQAVAPATERKKTTAIIDSTIRKKRPGSGLRNKVNGIIGKNS